MYWKSKVQFYSFNHLLYQLTLSHPLIRYYFCKIWAINFFTCSILRKLFEIDMKHIPLIKVVSSSFNENVDEDIDDVTFELSNEAYSVETDTNWFQFLLPAICVLTRSYDMNLSIITRKSDFHFEGSKFPTIHVEDHKLIMSIFDKSEKGFLTSKSILTSINRPVFENSFQAFINHLCYWNEEVSH